MFKYKLKVLLPMHNISFKVPHSVLELESISQELLYQARKYTPCYDNQTKTKKLVVIINQAANTSIHTVVSAMKAYFQYQGNICDLLGNHEIGLWIHIMICARILFDKLGEYYVINSEVFNTQGGRDV